MNPKLVDRDFDARTCKYFQPLYFSESGNHEYTEDADPLDFIQKYGSELSWYSR